MKLDGMKAYLVMFVAIIFNGLIVMGYIDESMREGVNSILGFLGLGALRSGIKKVEK